MNYKLNELVLKGALVFIAPCNEIYCKGLLFEVKS